MRTFLISAILIAAPISAVAQSGGWVDKLTNQQGSVCCYNSDGRRLDDPEWRTAGNNYEVLFTEGWIKVPADAVVPGRNQDGIARVWSVPFPDNGRMVRCFLPGSMG